MSTFNVKSPAEQRILRSRRRFLQLTGASIVSLPFLRGLPGYAQAEAPKFLALALKGNGIVRHTWGADKLSDARGQIKFRPTLTPLVGLEEYVTVVNGLKAKAADLAGGTHEGGMASVWTGKAVQAGAGASIDQIVAATASGTGRKSVELRAMSPNDELNRTPNNRMIFDAAGTPVDPREDAAAAFDQLFAGVLGGAQMMDPNRARQKLLFSHVDKQLASVAPKLCNEDRAHLDAMRAGWSQLATTVGQTVQCDPKNPSSISDVDPMRRASRQMIELLVMCFACGVTRIGSLQWSQGRSDWIASSLGITRAHHDISHDQPQAHVFEEYVPYPEDRWLHHVDAPTPAMLQNYASIWEPLNKIDTFYMEEFAHLLKRLKAFPAPGGGTLLDQALVVFSTEIDNGAGHDHQNNPYLLAGGAGGRLNRGTVINLPVTSQQIEQNNANMPPAGLRYHNDLLVTIAHLMGRTDVKTIGPAEFNQGPIAALMV